MDGTTIADAKGVVAPINFIAPMKEKPYSYNCEPPPGVPARNTREETHTVKIIDARPFNDTLSLDREGFVLLSYATAATDLYDEAQIKSVYYPECERLIRDYTGAARVHVFDHIVRNAARMAKGNGIKGYAGRVHNDYTAWSAPQRVRDLMGDEAEELLRRRYAEINVWRPIRGPLLR
ncbi:MAG: CmcJ/NvfI family oxidoreductase, partial [Alphaproteobacteria bacterium]